MLKTVLAVTTALTIAGSSVAYAQPGTRERDPQRRWQPSIEDIRAFQAARLAALRAGLVLNAEQEKHWPAFEQAARELQQLRLNRINARREARRDEGRRTFDPAELLRQRATRMTETGTVLKKLADAADPLYRSLDDAQRRRFAVLSRMMGPRGPQLRGRDRGQGDPNRERGQRRTEAAPGKTASMPVTEITLVKPAGMLTVELITPVVNRKVVDTANVEPGIARKSTATNMKVTNTKATNMKAVGFNRKPTGTNRKDAGDSI